MKIIRVLLIGCGGVGGSLLEQIVSNRERHAADGVRIAVAGVCDSRSVLQAHISAGHNDIDDDVLKAILEAKAAGKSMTEICKEKLLEGILVADLSPPPADDLRNLIKSILRSEDTVLNAKHGLVVVDCSASESLAPVLASAVQHDGCCVVLANKKPMTSSLEVYDGLMSTARRFRYEATVGAGLPVNTMLRRMVSAGDEVRRIAGALSGTLGYVMSGLQDGRPFSDVVTDAKRLGYTEPDPRDDLAGMDVARKALIMARQLGWRLNMEDVKVESLYPDTLSPAFMSSGDFMASLTELDESYRHRCQEAKEQGCILRYAAVVENGTCCVGLVSVPQHSPLGRLRGSDNLVEITSRCYSGSPLIIQGAGAGNYTTANGVLADILDLQDVV
ncbi:hypothetical protein CBR_g24080 [Chara braunii]|uniref:Homoserine dehydrogenase n=1 Tax=Chara braunii TaxID=69332 RepID=A0A388L5R3_CHABU|nr:hypothetical protein CBR_g24080 [Chara braunii]|eukprot:GBG77634.1 hypothetical protein CBR_g24080 [Chara braunii]